MTRAAILLLAVGLAAFGWELWPDDPARAGFVSQALLTMTALLMVAFPARRASLFLAPVALAGAALEVLTAACGLWFDALASQAVGVCDEGTGRPIRAACGVAVLVLAACALGRLDDSAA